MEQQQQQQQQRGLCSFAPGRSACFGTGVSTSTGQPTMRLSITSTTGSPVELTVPRGETVEGLRTHISQKLRLQTNRIVLLYRDRQLTAGKLMDLGVADGSKLTLVPVIEAGLVCSTVRAERSMMDVLESLTEAQISDFLSGRSPLTINLGIGAHVMYVQLQLSAQNVAELQQQQQQQQQQHRDLRAESSSSSSSSSSELQTGLPTAVRTSHPDSAWTNATRSTTSPASHTSTPTPDSSDTASSTQFSAQRPRTSSNSTAPMPHSSTTTAPAVNCHHHSPPHQPCPPNSTHTSSSSISTPHFSSGCPHPCFPLQAATPVCSSSPAGSIPGPQSPTPASTFQESGVHASSTAELCKQPGAVIESFVSHSPGIFSGTFSGSLGPCSQSSIHHPRSGINIILQILNDLLRAAYHHQGAQPALPHLHSPATNSSSSVSSEQSKAKSKTVVTQRAEQLSKTSGEESHPLHSSTLENQALQSKLERLQFLMHQRRLRRRTRRNSHFSQTSYPYQHRHHRP